MLDGSSAFDTEARALEHVDKALNYQRMGLISSAENELRLAREVHPTIVSHPRYQAFQVQKVEKDAQVGAWKMPMRVGAGILIGDILMIFFFWLMSLNRSNSSAFLVWGLVRISIDVYLAFSLLRLKDNARRATIWWAVLVLIGGLSNLIVGAWLDLVMQLSLAGALLLLLVGKPSKLRAVLAAGLFILGYFGSFCGAMILYATST